MSAPTHGGRPRNIGAMLYHWERGMRRYHIEARVYREWRRVAVAVLRSEAFARVLAAEPDDVQAAQLVLHLLQIPALANLQRHELEDLRSRELQAREEAEAAARVLRRYVQQALLATGARATILEDAENIEHQSHLRWTPGPPPFPWDPSTTIGQKLDKRAMAIREVARWVPETTENRDAAIAELLRLAGARSVTRQLVRSTIRRGHT
jgi:hypothetical protein